MGLGKESEFRNYMDIVGESNHALTIELVVNIEYEQMATAILAWEET